MYYRFYNVKEVDTNADILNFLDKCKIGQLIIGENALQHNKYYVLKGYQEDNNNFFGIAIISEGHGLIPEVLHIQEKSKLIIGVNNNVFVINYLKRNVEYTFSFESLFYNFLQTKDNHIIIAIFETGVLAFNKKFEVIWKFYGDIVSESHIDGNVLKLYFMNGEIMNLSIIDGSVQSRL